MVGSQDIDISDVVKYIESAIPTVLVKYVADVVEDILSDCIENIVYDGSFPREGGWIGGTTYHRRHQLEKGIKSWIGKKNTLYTTSVAHPDGPVIRGSVHYGMEDGGFFKILESENRGFIGYRTPRIVIDPAQEKVNESQEIENMFAYGIEMELGR